MCRRAHRCTTATVRTISASATATNNDCREVLSSKGLTLCGLSPDGHIVEAVELDNGSFFVGVQFHPEFKSRPNKAHPLFRGFVGAAVKGLKE